MGKSRWKIWGGFQRCCLFMARICFWLVYAHHNLGSPIFILQRTCSWTEKENRPKEIGLPRGSGSGRTGWRFWPEPALFLRLCEGALSPQKKLLGDDPGPFGLWHLHGATTSHQFSGACNTPLYDPRRLPAISFKVVSQWCVVWVRRVRLGRFALWSWGASLVFG